MKLQDTLAALRGGTIELTDGVVAQLTREKYREPYLNIINYERFIPVFSYNLINNFIQIMSGNAVMFTDDDIYVYDDWVVLNAQA